MQIQPHSALPEIDFLAGIAEGPDEDKSVYGQQSQYKWRPIFFNCTIMLLVPLFSIIIVRRLLVRSLPTWVTNVLLNDQSSFLARVAIATRAVVLLTLVADVTHRVDSAPQVVWNPTCPRYRFVSHVGQETTRLSLKRITVPVLKLRAVTSIITALIDKKCNFFGRSNTKVCSFGY